MRAQFGTIPNIWISFRFIFIIYIVIISFENSLTQIMQLIGTLVNITYVVFNTPKQNVRCLN